MKPGQYVALNHYHYHYGPPKHILLLKIMSYSDGFYLKWIKCHPCTSWKPGNIIYMSEDHLKSSLLEVFDSREEALAYEVLEK